ncbi:MAG: hypothetical protein ACKV2V_25330 [Blastocatellia bacterium]
MKKNLIKRAALLTGALALCLTAFFTLPTPQQASAQTPAGCIQFDAGLVTHGFTRTAAFPNGDQFLLSNKLRFTVTSPAAQGGAKITASQFGSDPGYLAGTTPEGISSSTASSTVRALSCLDNYWDLNFYVATKGATEGDMVRLFLQTADGSKVVEVAMFTITGGVLKLISQTSDVSIHLNDRFARGSNALTTTFISTAPFSSAAGDSGNRTQLLTVAFSMLPTAATMGCFQLGFDVKRAAGAGSTSVIVGDVVVNRNTVAGDTARTQAGLLGGLTGGYPTGAKCDAVCPACPPVSGGGGGPVAKCHTICFQSAEYYLLKYDCLAALTFLDSAAIYIPGANYNGALNVGANFDTFRIALRGGSPFGTRPRNAYGRFVQQYVAAQMSLFQSASGVARYDALWGGLSCYGFPAGILPVSLSTGVTITNDSMLKDIFEQAYFAMKSGNAADQEKLGIMLEAINGHTPGYRACNDFN